MKTFWILWNPEGETPPRVRFATEEGAKETAEKLQTRIGVGTMYVMEAKTSYNVSLKTKWEKADK